MTHFQTIAKTAEAELRIKTQLLWLLQSLYVSVKTDDMTAPSEQCQNILMSSIDWFEYAAQIQLFYGGNDGSIKDYFVCIVLLVKHPHLDLRLLL